MIIRKYKSIYEGRNIERQILSKPIYFCWHVSYFVGSPIEVPYNLTYTIDALDASKWTSTFMMRLSARF